MRKMRPCQTTPGTAARQDGKLVPAGASVTVLVHYCHCGYGRHEGGSWWAASRRRHGPHAAVAAHGPRASDAGIKETVSMVDDHQQAPVMRQSNHRRAVAVASIPADVTGQQGQPAGTTPYSATDPELLLALAKQLHASVDAVEQLASRQPQLLGRQQPINLLVSKLHELQQRLGLQMHEMQDMAAALGFEQHVLNSLVAKQPEFLAVPYLRLSMRATQLAVLLNLTKHPTPAKQRKLVYASPAAAAAAAALQQQQQQELQLPYPRLGASLLEHEAAAELAMQCDMNLGNTLQPWEHAAAVQSGNLIPPQHLKGGSAALQRRLSSDPNSVSERTAQHAHTSGQGNAASRNRTPQFAAAARLLGQKQAEAESAAKLAGLQVLARLPSQQFFDLMALPGSALLSRLLVLEDLLQLGSPQATAAMVAQCPALLLQPVQDTMDAWAALCAGPLQGVAPGAARRWLLRCPYLLCYPADQLAATFATVCSELGLPVAAAGKRVMQTPYLMRQTAEGFVQQLQRLQRLLQVSAFEARRMVRNSPGIIVYSETALSRKVSDLSGLLQLDHAAVSDVLLRQPALLTQSTTTLQLKVTQLCSFLDMTEPQVRRMVLAEPTLLTCKPTSLQAKAQGLQAMFGWNSLQLQHLLLHLSGLLMVSKAQLQQHVMELSMLLDLPVQPCVRELVAAWPRGLAGQFTAEEVAGGISLLVQHLHKVQQQRGSCAHKLPQQQFAGSATHARQVQDSNFVIIDSGAEGHTLEEAASLHTKLLHTAIRAVCKQPVLLDRAVQSYLAQQHHIDGTV